MKKKRPVNNDAFMKRLLQQDAPILVACIKILEDEMARRPVIAKLADEVLGLLHEKDITFDELKMALKKGESDGQVQKPGD